MRRFSIEEIVAIMSAEHRKNTAWALQKPEAELSVLDLIAHWLEFHIVPIIHFNVSESDFERR